MKKQTTLLLDDIDGTEAVKTVSFAFDGVQYEIDLSEEHLAEITADLEKWSAAARRVGGRRRVGAITSARLSSKMRQWAIEQGIEISDRGRIPAPVQEAYREAHPEEL